ncbi:MAG: zinc-ribbon domain-containing protein [Sarcina sp.]
MIENEWNYKKNGKMKLDDFGYFSNKKVWWICENGHEWEALINNRRKGTGCPFCAKKRATELYNLKVENIELANEWNYDKNGSDIPEKFTPNSNKKVWWICEKGHEWQANINSRNTGNGCPFCSNQKVCKDNCLETTNPELLLEWDYNNNKKTPSEVISGSSEKVWWICKKGHSWKTNINIRTKGSGCPFCSNQKVCKDNCLETTNPEILREWDYNKNSILPNEILAGTHRKVWWICEKNHKWEASVVKRVREKKGCPFCSGQRVCKENSLAIFRPDLLKEWDYIKNLEVTPENITKSSGKKVWWICEKKHSWESAVNNRTNKGTNCPFCAGQKVCDENSLYVQRKDLCGEWNYKKNINVDIKDFTISSGKKVWWKCRKGHEWKAIIASRTRGSNCPKCSNNTSEADKAIFYVMKKIFSDAQLRYLFKINNENIEGDCYVPNLNLVIEYDGYYHINKLEKDIEKKYKLLNAGYKLILIRDERLPKINIECIKIIKKEKQKLNIVIKEILLELEKIKKFSLNEYLSFQKVMKELDDFEAFRLAYLNEFLKDKDKKSLLNLYPQIAEEWSKKNVSILPQDVTAGSGLVVWWKCKDKGHEWKTTVAERTRGRGCPFCTGRRVCEENSFAKKFPDISTMWNYEKNEGLTPLDVTYGSNKEVWWICENGHEWKKRISKITKIKNCKCPICRKLL